MSTNPHISTKRDITLMIQALSWAKESKCSRRQVGAVIAIDDRVISTGFNGSPPGWSSDSDLDCGEYYYNFCKVCFNNDPIDVTHCSECKCPYTEDNKSIKTDHSLAIHAEANAILFAGRASISCVSGTLYCTTSPCIECAKLIMTAGIVRVVYLDEYRDLKGVQNLKKYGIQVDRLDKNLIIDRLNEIKEMTNSINLYYDNTCTAC